MANELVFSSTTGQASLKAVISSFAQTYWDEDTDTLQADYDTAVTETLTTFTEHDGSGVYYGDWPTALTTVGRYIVLVLNSSNTKITSFVFNWSGTAEVTVQNPTNVTIEGAEISIT